MCRYMDIPVRNPEKDGLVLCPVEEHVSKHEFVDTADGVLGDTNNHWACLHGVMWPELCIRCSVGTW